jgi:hypothetical protein
MIAGIQVVQEAITDMKKLVPSEFSDINLEELNEQLKDCAQALENQDYVSLSDLIGFAVQTTLQGYFSVLQKGVLQ